ncbi:hypothetical protein QAD02_014135 [Eretmocerus hayati]|uniref:Uncharacterized protein n=1 Tax=Eretmocerus hayati TaxID=131215 RepID=A0ACC2P5G9_9HYME|nr:hypothetical protein QAD02_014135 [Eretmocerus hayati]
MVLLNISSSVHGDLDTNENIRLNKSTSLFSYVKPGVYKDIELLVAEINELDSISKHLKFKVARGGYVTVERICTDDTCSALKHTLQLSKRLRNILGFDPYVHDIHVNLKEPTVGKFPGSLANGLPNMLMIYADICEPYYTGSSRSKLLRVVPLDTHNYAYGGVKIKNFAPPIRKSSTGTPVVTKFVYSVYFLQHILERPSEPVPPFTRIALVQTQKMLPCWILGIQNLIYT